MKKQIGLILLGLGMMLWMAASVSATCRNRIRLMPTPEGATINARGQAEVRADERRRERFKVEIEANVPDGTRFSVYADDIFVVEAATRGGRVEVELRSERGTLPAEIRPVCDIRSIAVTDEEGITLLFGDFF